MSVPRRVVSPLEASVRRTIASAGKSSPDVKKSWQAELALTLVREIEARSDDSLSARVSAGKLLAETMAQIQSAAPAEQPKDRLDELSAKRAKRTASA